MRLDASAVAGLVFWSKDYRPFLRYLDELDAKGYQAVFMFTITGLPRAFDPRVPEARRSGNSATIRVL